jgi:hypothetical protein
MGKNIFFVALILAASGLVSPPIALLGGLIYGFTTAHPFHVESKGLAKFLLQASVVALGLGMNLHEVLPAGRSGFLYTAVSITVAMLLGLGFGYLLHVGKKSAFLISAGTAICGGSAIAAVGPIAEASEEEMGVSLGAVFILNSVALFLFPLIGHGFHMTQAQFGLWSALANSRHQLRRRRNRQVWPNRAGHRHHDQAGARALDCSPVACDSHHSEEQGAYPVAVVHPLLLSRCSAEHLDAGT